MLIFDTHSSAENRVTGEFGADERRRQRPPVLLLLQIHTVHSVI